MTTPPTPLYQRLSILCIRGILDFVYAHPGIRCRSPISDIYAFTLPPLHGLRVASVMPHVLG